MKAIRTLDKYVLRIVSRLQGFFTRQRSLPNNPREILVIKLWAVGDAIVSLPLVQQIQQKYPNSTVTILCHRSNSWVYKNLPVKIQHLNASFIFTNWSKFDIVFDLEPYLNLSAIIAFLTGKYRIGFSNQPRSNIYHRKVGLNVSTHMVQNYCNFLPGANNQPSELVRLNVDENKLSIFKNQKKSLWVVINPLIDASAQTREWPIENYLSALRNLQDDSQVYIIGGVNDSRLEKLQQNMTKSNIPCTNLAGKLSWKETGALLQVADLFIGSDGGPMHLAAAQGCKTIGLFGPNLPTLWRPYGPNGIPVYAGEHCSPCIRNSEGKVPTCYYANTKQERQCMKNISAKQVKNLVDLHIRS